MTLTIFGDHIWILCKLCVCKHVCIYFFIYVFIFLWLFLLFCHIYNSIIIKCFFTYVIWMCTCVCICVYIYKKGVDICYVGCIAVVCLGRKGEKNNNNNNKYYMRQTEQNLIINNIFYILWHCYTQFLVSVLKYKKDC